MRNKIDFPVSDLWRDWYASQGLTEYNYSKEINELRERIARLEVENRIMMEKISQLTPNKVTYKKTEDLEEVLKRF